MIFATGFLEALILEVAARHPTGSTNPDQASRLPKRRRTNVRTAICRQMTLAAEPCVRRRRWFSALRWGTRQRVNMGRLWFGVAMLQVAPPVALQSLTIAAGIELEGHDVSHRNLCELQERGTTAIRRMVPPQSAQVAKSLAASLRSCS